MSGPERSPPPAPPAPPAADPHGGTIQPVTSVPLSGPSDPPDSELPEEPVELRAGMEPVPGYRLVKVLGSGGFGSVWLAEAPGGFRVAVKFVPLVGRLAASERKSLPVLRSVRHPHVLTTFGAWETGGRLVIAMELADRTVADRLKEARGQGLTGVPPDELLHYMRGAAKGLDYLNQPRPPGDGEPVQSIQHRDVKPQNLLLMADHVKVGDFGLARVLEGTVGKHSGGFTPAYSAPESFAGESARQSDQYSLAVAYCELRGGRLPFTGAIGEMVLGHMERPPDLGMIPPAERPAVARALAKKPADRWPTCGAFVEAVAAAVASETASEPVELTTVYRPRPRRSVVPFVAGGLVVAVLAGVALVLAFAMTKNGDPVAVTSSPAESPATEHIAPATSRPTESETRPSENIPPPTTPVTRPATSPPTVKATPPIAQPPKEDPPGNQLRFEKHAKKAVRGVAWVPKSKLVVSCGDDGEVWVWDTSPGGKANQLVGHTGIVHAVAVSDDGTRALTAGDDMTVRLWDLVKGEQIHKMTKAMNNPAELPFEVYGVAFDGNTQAVSAGNSNAIIHWVLKTGTEVNVTRTNTGLSEVFAFARSPDGKQFVLGGAGGLVMTHAAANGVEVAYIGHTDDVLAAAWFPDGERFVTAGGGKGQAEGAKDYTVRVWTLGKKKFTPLDGHTSRVTSVAVSPDGKRVLSGDLAGRLRLWDVKSEKELPPIDADAKDPSAVNAVAISSDGSEAVSGHEDGTVRMWRLPK